MQLLHPIGDLRLVPHIGVPGDRQDAGEVQDVSFQHDVVGDHRGQDVEIARAGKHRRTKAEEIQGLFLEEAKTHCVQRREVVTELRCGAWQVVEGEEGVRGQHAEAGVGEAVPAGAEDVGTCLADLVSGVGVEVVDSEALGALEQEELLVTA